MHSDVGYQIKKIIVEKMLLQVLKNKVNAIRMNIEIMQQKKSVYVQKMGQEKYSNQIVSLMN